jgi:hypothetical protein
MIARFFFALVLCLGPARSDAWLIQKPSTAYVGPGDVAPYTAWFSCTFGYSAAVAAPGTTSACRVRRGSDSSETDIAIMSNGLLDVATAAAFTSVDAIGTGDISGTTLTFTGGTIGDIVTGGGTLPGTFILAGASPTWTVNISQTVASATLTLTYGLFVTKIYDQVAGGACTGSCDLVPLNANRQPILLLTGCGADGTLPCVFGRSVLPTAFSFQESAGNFTPDANGMISLTNVGNRRIGGAGHIMFAAPNPGNRITGGTLPDTWAIIPGGNGPATDNTWHVANGIIDGAGTAIINIDGTENSYSDSATLDPGPLYALQAHTNGPTYTMQGEMGVRNGAAWDASTRTALCHNQRLRWTTAGAC